MSLLEAQEIVSIQLISLASREHLFLLLPNPLSPLVSIQLISLASREIEKWCSGTRSTRRFHSIDLSSE